MESLDYMVDKVVNFFEYTLPTSKVGGPFTPSTLQEMFTAAHFCADLASDSLPPSYHPAVEQLQAQFPLLSAAQLLLLSLGDNVRVNRQSMDTARQLHDRQGEDLDSWLYCSQRNQTRDQFILASQQLKETGQWEQLRSYMCLVELSRREGRGLEKLVRERTERMLGALLVNDEQFRNIQQKIVEQVTYSMNLEKLEILDKEVLAEVVGRKQEILKVVVKVITETLENDDSLEIIERVAELLKSLVSHCKYSVGRDLLGKIEMGIRTRFVREELTNCLAVRVRLGTKIED